MVEIKSSKPIRIRIATAADGSWVKESDLSPEDKQTALFEGRAIMRDAKEKNLPLPGIIMMEIIGDLTRATKIIDNDLVVDFGLLPAKARFIYDWLNSKGFNPELLFNRKMTKFSMVIGK